MITRKKSLLQSIPLGAKLLIGFILLSVGMAMLGGSKAPVETGLWIFIGVVVTSALTLVIVALIISFRKRPKPKKVEDKPAEKHAEAHPEAAPTKKADHGHGGHMSGGQNFLFWSLGLLMFAVAVFGVAFGLRELFGQDSPPGVRSQSASRPGANTPAGYSRRQAGVSLDWVPISAPADGWETIIGKAGYNIYVCVPSIDPNCAATVPAGFRMRCVLMDGVTETDWDTRGSCRKYLQLRLQSTGTRSLPMNYRYVPS